MYDYMPNAEEEIEIREGDIIRIYEKIDDDWWFGKKDHDVGLVPATYLEEVCLKLNIRILLKSLLQNQFLIIFK